MEHLAVSRRSFIASSAVFAAGVGGADAVSGVQVPSGAPSLKVGIVSDTHVHDRGQKQKEKLDMLAKVFRLFDSEKVDAVLMPGDIGHGPIGSLEMLAETYFSVFPGDKGSDGRHVERLFVTGNHDIDEWLYQKKSSETREQCAERNCGNAFHFHREEVWERLFHEPYRPYFLKEVKGYKFLLRHWPSLYLKEPYPVEEAFAEYGDMLAKERLFFYCQHEQPSATVNANHRLLKDGEWYSNAETKGSDLARKVLVRYPNCIALTGHSHCPLNDERSIWQGEFTAVNCGHMSGWAFVGPGRENGHDHEGAKPPVREMQPFDFCDVHDAMVMSVYRDVVRFQRLDVKRDAPLGPDWIVPVDPADRPYAWETRRAASKPPRFAAKAKVSVKEIADGADRSGARHAQLEVSFPPVTSASGGDRAHDYSVKLEMMIGDTVRTVDEKRVFSPHVAHGEEFEKEPVKCLFARSSVPIGRKVRFVATPFNCWLKAGEPIASAWSRFK